jgi:hypothetical protein
MIDELPFKVVRSNGHDEVLARAMNLLRAHHGGSGSDQARTRAAIHGSRLMRRPLDRR